MPMIAAFQRGHLVFAKCLVEVGAAEDIRGYPRTKLSTGCTLMSIARLHGRLARSRQVAA